MSVCYFYSTCFRFKSTENNLYAASTPIEPSNPCIPSPCGPNSQCRDLNGVSVCSCLSTFTGSPPGCRPECTASSECPSEKACMNQKCKDPCPSVCGSNALCQVRNHSPICVCNDGYTGNPFTVCYIVTSKTTLTRLKLPFTSNFEYLY